MTHPDIAAAQPGSEPRDEDGAGAAVALFGARGLFGVTGLLGLGAWYGQDTIVLLAGLALATGLVARFWAALSLHGVQLETALGARRAFPGDRVTLAARLENRKLLPLTWLEAEYGLPAALAPNDPAIAPALEPGRKLLRMATPLGAYRHTTLTRELACTRRGHFRIGPVRLRSTDVFGLFVRSRTIGAPLFLTVYPQIRALADFGLPSRQPLGAHRDPSRLFEDPGRPMGLRPYTPETPFKSVAWKATARSGALIAKRDEPTVRRDVALFLAIDSFPKAVPQDDFEAAISVTASLAVHELATHRPVGVYANGERAGASGPLVIPAGRAHDQETVILDSLARLARASTGPFDAFLEAELAATAGRATLVVVGARFSVPALERLRHQQRRGRPVVLLIAGDNPLPAGALSCRRIGDFLEPAA